MQEADHKLQVTYGFLSPEEEVTRRRTHGCTDVPVNAEELISPRWPERGQGREEMSEYVFDPEETHYSTASIHIKYVTPLIFLSLFVSAIQYYTVWLTSCSHRPPYSLWLDKTMQLLFSHCFVCLMSKEAWGHKCRSFFLCLSVCLFVFFSNPGD